ncbi:tRNA1(Val) (adenine(37)-N6)-methyltransferase [Pullulanibacillus sp. KACC 23026]|uniref:tRNA1(Val) (adenine(37)-N6)-methyltransferase n=1 Tax=Pullulanibacillus sp. KACC 23026 TaxID=3028315 RepID=UPI0023AEB706|nr:tRNA1(Val) (adenine(37)-N6)-methyltransferase [Pullulanibacillus sp. KACC 23026]WEG12748.1 tRNA1(Val) (adenine(37)-N6)-methyltransferase [Pullulanibacillus sp. KACC 23026]
MVLLQENERIDTLFDSDLTIIQSPEVFSFSLDAVLLAHFASVPIQGGEMVDLCSGNGAVALMLTERSKAHITEIELQPRLHDMAVRSVQLNKLEHQVTCKLGNAKDSPSELGFSRFDVVTCNPPYFSRAQTERINPNPHLALARHELEITLDEVVQVSSQLLKQKGKAAFVHRPERLVDLLFAMRKYRLEPKRLCYVYPKKGRDANIILVEGIKDGKSGLKVLPPLLVYGEDGQYTKELSAFVS